jgi:hypothetical protein
MNNDFLMEVIIEGENMVLNKSGKNKDLRTLAAVSQVKLDFSPLTNNIVLRFIE